jgi:hypothetical protein
VVLERCVYFHRGRSSFVLFVLAGQTARRIEQHWFSGHLANRDGSEMSSGFITVSLPFIPYFPTTTENFCVYVYVCICIESLCIPCRSVGVEV